MLSVSGARSVTRRDEEESMNKIVTSKNTVRIEIKGWDKIWSFKGSLTIPKLVLVH